MTLSKFAILAIFVALATPAIAEETFEIDSDKSKITFKINNKPPKANEFQEVTGSFKKFSGTVVFNEEEPAKSSVKIDVDTASVDTANKKRDDHLRNQDFFKAKEYTKMTFASISVTRNEDGNYNVKGKFTLLDKTKELTVLFKPTGSNSGTTTFQIKRSDFGMNYRIPDTADQVDVNLEIVGKKKE